MTDGNDSDQYRQAIVDAVRRAKSLGKPPRAAWLAQQLRKQYPGFSPQALGFPTFGAFLGTLGGLRIASDQYDLVVELLDDDPSTGALRHQQQQTRPYRLERVHPALWKAFTRSGTAPAFLDVQAVRTTRKVVVRFDELDHIAAAGDRFVPIPTTQVSEQVQWAKAWAMETLDADLAGELETALRHGGLDHAIELLKDKEQYRVFQAARVEWTKSRMREWLSSIGIRWAPPVVTAPTERQRARKEDDRSDLHKLVHEIVDRLNDEDLRQLRLPLGHILDVLSD